MVQLTRQTVVLAKLETTAGADALPDATNVINCFDVDVNPVIGKAERMQYKPTIGVGQSIPTTREAEVTFKTYLQSTPADETAPEIGVLWQGVGFQEVAYQDANLVTHYKYTPISTGHKTLTIYVYKGGWLHKVVGSMGNCVINAQVNDLPVVEWTFKGRLLSVAPSSAPSVTYTQSNLEAVQGANCTFASWAGVMSSFKLDLGNDLKARPNLNDDTGIEGYIIAARVPKITIDPEADPNAMDVWAKLLNNESGAISISLNPSREVKIDIPVADLDEVAYGDRDGVINTPLTFVALETNGDDEFTIDYTDAAV